MWGESYAKSHEMLFFPFSCLHWHYLTSHSFAVLFTAENIFPAKKRGRSDFGRENLEKILCKYASLKGLEYFERCFKNILWIKIYTPSDSHGLHDDMMVKFITLVGQIKNVF